MTDGKERWGPVRPVSEVIEPVDAGPYLDLMVHRFGMAREVFDPYLFFKPKKRSIWVVHRNLWVPARPDPHSVGMQFFRTKMRFPRPSTNAVLKFGGAATKNTVALGDDEIAQALFRRTLELDPERAWPIEGNGYVLLFYRGRPLGIGYFSPAKERPGGELKAMCPKKWTSKLGLRPPAQRPVPWEE